VDEATIQPFAISEIIAEATVDDASVLYCSVE
jgi:hypothetical protein